MITHMFIILHIVLAVWWPPTVECSFFIFAFYLCCWHGMYFVTFPVLCNVTVWMEINSNTNT